MNKGIYKIINPENKIYIGCTSNLSKRIKDYEKCLIKTQPLILESIIKYGWDNHKFEIIEYTNDLIKREKYWISFYNSYQNGLNSNNGGGGVKKHSLKTRKLISEKGLSNKGNRVKSHWKGKKKPKYIGEKISKTKKERKIKSHWKGKKRGKEFGLKLSKSKKNKPNLLNRKVIYQLDKNNKVIKKWDSITEASIGLKCNPTGISNALIKGIKYTSAGYKWVYNLNTITY